MGHWHEQWSFVEVRPWTMCSLPWSPLMISTSCSLLKGDPGISLSVFSFLYLDRTLGWCGFSSLISPHLSINYIVFIFHCIYCSIINFIGLELYLLGDISHPSMLKAWVRFWAIGCRSHKGFRDGGSSCCLSLKISQYYTLPINGHIIYCLPMVIWYIAYQLCRIHCLPTVIL